jgi:hypothetical protein
VQCPVPRLKAVYMVHATLLAGQPHRLLLLATAALPEPSICTQHQHGQAEFTSHKETALWGVQHKPQVDAHMGSCRLQGQCTGSSRQPAGQLLSDACPLLEAGGIHLVMVKDKA